MVKTAAGDCGGRVGGRGEREPAAGGSSAGDFAQGFFGGLGNLN